MLKKSSPTGSARSGGTAETNRSLRGHTFLPPEPERVRVPGELEQDGDSPGEAVVHLHYFSPAADWWITELWQDPDRPGRWWGFGFARLVIAPGGGEWGCIDMNRLEALRVLRPAGPPRVVERDLRWRPAPARECVPGLV